jgi:hypothetical protein
METEEVVVPASPTTNEACPEYVPQSVWTTEPHTLVIYQNTRTIKLLSSIRVAVWLLFWVPLAAGLILAMTRC